MKKPTREGGATSIWAMLLEQVAEEVREGEQFPFWVWAAFSVGLAGAIGVGA